MIKIDKMVTNVPNHAIPYNLISLKSPPPPELHPIAYSYRKWSKQNDADGINEGYSSNALYSPWKREKFSYHRENAKCAY